MTGLGPICSAQALSSCGGELGPVFALVPGLLFAMASLVTERGPQVRSPQQLQRVDSGFRVQALEHWAQELWLTGLTAGRTELVSPA